MMTKDIFITSSMLARVVPVLARSNTVQVVVGASRLVIIIIGNWKSVALVVCYATACA